MTLKKVDVKKCPKCGADLIVHRDGYEGRARGEECTNPKCDYAAGDV